MVENQHQQIAGYRDMPQEDIDLINAIKEKEQELVDLFKRVRDLKGEDGPWSSDRWQAIAQQNLETGFMYLIKAVACPTNGLGLL